MLAHCCFYLPDGEFDSEATVDLEPMPKGIGPTYRVRLPAKIGVTVGWRVIVNQSLACRATSARLEGEVVEIELTKAALTPTT